MGLLELQKIRQERNVPKPKKIYKIAPKSKKRLEQEKQQKNASGQWEETELDKWFEARRKEMSGKCCLCGGRTEKNNNETYRRSIHHLFDKRPTMFPSVATNVDNWLELCHFGNSCHDNVHNKTITWELLRDSAEWSMIVNKFKKVYPFIAENEKYRIPEILTNFL